MTTRFLGPTGSRRRSTRTSLLLMALLGLVLGVMIGGGGFSSAASTSPSVADYSQCANGTAESTACDDGWINGILNSSNSSYREDEVTPQRLVADFPKSGAHSFDISYLVRKADSHAYDSLATWNHTESGATRCLGFNGKALSNCQAATSGSPSMTPIPDDPLAVDSTCTTESTTTSDHQLGGQEFQMFGGTLNALTASAYTGTTSDTSQGLYEN